MNRSNAEERRARLPEWRATLAWILESWRRPAGAEASWQQNAERRGASADGGGA
jgi:hypothetical protein